jgi:starch phosphorylase
MEIHARTVRAQLDRLAANVRWAWRPEVRELFVTLDPELWRATGRNPVQLLRQLHPERFQQVLADTSLCGRINAAAAELERYLHDTDTWCARTDAAPGATIAYFSAEFALADCLRTYSGGLGVLAGDHLRSASDLGVPLLGVGLAYRDGYFTQTLDASGWQHAEPAVNDLHRAPAELVTDEAGAPVLVRVELGDGVVVARAWVIHVGRVPLYLLDTDVEDNAEHHRDITRQLYGGDDDTRLRQELVLGVGGVRLLAALGLAPTVIHLNEGHAALAGLERLRVHLAGGRSFPEAVDAVREELVFTTHTPVPAGHDAFDWDLAAWHLGPLAASMQVDFRALWDLATGEGDSQFSQTILALSLARTANGVARLHGEVSRRMFARLWPGRAADEVPIGHITNGVHPGSWVGRDVAALFDEHLGDGWRTTDDPSVWEGVRAIAGPALWSAHRAARHRLVLEARGRLAAQTARLGVGPDGSGLDPDALTVGFARRFATYKRATLLAYDLDRLEAIVADADRPVQLLIAGKAHPHDRYGKALIQQLVELSRDPRFRGRIAFLEGYDLDLAAALVAGVDVWLNNPLRPLEASGTSGMKAAMNGVLNLSILDGWWDEAVADLTGAAEVGFGWSIGDTDETAPQEERDAKDAGSLYRVLTDEVVPTFHDRDADGIPVRWTTMMQDAISLLAPRFSTHRMVADYVRSSYVPAEPRDRDAQALLGV